MKLILTLDFPDELEMSFHSRFAKALEEYVKQVAHNNAFKNVHTGNITELGRTKGPNKFMSSNGIKLVEQVIE